MFQRCLLSGDDGSQGGAQGTAPSILFGQSEARKAKKDYFIFEARTLTDLMIRIRHC